MPERLPYVRFLSHKVCAHPTLISWALGAIALWIPTTSYLIQHSIFEAMPSQGSLALLVILLYTIIGCLGVFPGMWVGWILLPKVCSRWNGGPYQGGEQVMVLCGPFAGSVTTVDDVTTGQDLYPVLIVHLSGPSRKSEKSFFADYAVLRMSPGRHLQATT